MGDAPPRAEAAGDAAVGGLDVVAATATAAAGALAAPGAGPCGRRRCGRCRRFAGRLLGGCPRGCLLGCLLGHPLVVGVAGTLQFEQVDLGGLQLLVVVRLLRGDLLVGALLRSELRVGLLLGRLRGILGGGHLVPGGAGGGVGVGLRDLGHLERAQDVDLVVGDVVQGRGALDQLAGPTGVQERRGRAHRRPVDVAVV
jgi:hypothetical protein